MVLLISPTSEYSVSPEVMKIIENNLLNDIDGWKMYEISIYDPVQIDDTIIQVTISVFEYGGRFLFDKTITLNNVMLTDFCLNFVKPIESNCETCTPKIVTIDELSNTLKTIFEKIINK